MDLVECDDVEANDGTALFKTVEAFRGALFFSTSVELKTKGAGGGGAGREMMDSNTSLPSILAPRHFLAVSHETIYKAWSPYSQKDRKHVLATMSQRAYNTSPGVDCKNLL